MMLRKVMFCMVALGLVSCGGQAPVDQSVAADKIAYNCAVSLRDAAIAWKKDNAGSEFYPSAPDLIDEVNMPKYNTTPCNDGDLAIGGSAAKNFDYWVAHTNGKAIFMATIESVSSKPM